MKKTVMTPLERELAYEEIEVLKLCQHPNLLRLCDVFEGEGHFYLVTELLEGGDLLDYLGKHDYRIPESHAAKIIRSLAAALYYLHSYGIIHRDLKPENVLFKSRDSIDEVKIIDFGLAKFTGPTEKCYESCGTLHYAAPELVDAKPYDKTADIWSLGVIAYLLVSGMLPFQNFDDKKLMLQIVHEEVAYPGFCWKKASPEALDFVKRILVKCPEKRMSLKEILEHPWLTQDIEGMKKVEKLNEFVAYTAVQPSAVLKLIRKKSNSIS
eukprot:TRINITY_DN4486_c0_g2_i2.p2 TRINITY_DN4486_c0_g2~~TRINITY_DN4486_c0_g2_i2.p2  ORF type:complete len:268 (+),score=93.12 TRINITY_DN4486_c0_g2_i2:1576-2379(+)